MVDNKSANTAIARSAASVPMRTLVKNEWIERGNHVFDWGCGKGADVEYLRANGFPTAIGYDPNHAPANRPMAHFRQFLYTTSIYVLNVILNPVERDYLLQDMRHFTNPGGMVCIAVRHEKEIASEAKKGNWRTTGDGFVTNAGTFQRGWNADSLSALLHGNGYGDVIVVNENPVIVMAHLHPFGYGPLVHRGDDRRDWM